jgi:xanthine/uracil/vitamin C permease (AzgA family)
VAFFALTVLGIRERIVDALPASLRHAIAVGIRLFVALLGSRRRASSSVRRTRASSTSAT